MPFRQTNRINDIIYRRTEKPMEPIQAYLDDFGKVTAIVNRNQNNGNAAGFYLSDETGKVLECIIAGVEEHQDCVRYHLTIPTTYDFAKAYILWEAHGLHTPLIVRFIVQTDEFDRLFTYDGNDLGALYHPTHTDFALWAPTAQEAGVRIYRQDGSSLIAAMRRGEKGVWRVRIQEDLKRATYIYVLQRHGEAISTTDPYAFGATANGRRSAVIDIHALETIKDESAFPKLQSYTDAILYECSVRDMTSSPDTGTKEHGTFNAFAENKTSRQGEPTGLEHIVSLGVSHVQLQPVNDFATVDEQNPHRSYNWGYDPACWMTLEGSYTNSPMDPYARMREFRKLIVNMHARGLRVNADVVFNHMYDAYDCNLNRVVPYYYFRYTDRHYLSNGSGCGNDIESRRPMTRHYLKHVLTTWMHLYHLDGFRFDLMGILDVETMNMLADACRAIKADVMIYGEGWDMPTALSPEEKARIYNQRQMPAIAHFNDTFRDVVKGGSADDRKYEKGFLTGAPDMGFEMCSVLAGNALGEPYFQRFDDPFRSINGVETHDNLTAWDKMHFCCRQEPRELRLKRLKMILAATLFAQGVPFLHAGIEFADSKQDCSNSYQAGDAINQMNWDRAHLNRELVQYTRACIAVRKKFRAFRLKSKEELQRCVSFDIPYMGVLYYDMHVPDEQTHTQQIKVIWNTLDSAHEVHFEECWSAILDENGLCEEIQQQDFTVPAYSAMVLKKRPVV